MKVSAHIASGGPVIVGGHLSVGSTIGGSPTAGGLLYVDALGNLASASAYVLDASQNLTVTNKTVVFYHTGSASHFQVRRSGDGYFAVDTLNARVLFNPVVNVSVNAHSIRNYPAIHSASTYYPLYIGANPTGNNFDAWAPTGSNALAKPYASIRNQFTPSTGGGANVTSHCSLEINPTVNGSVNAGGKFGALAVASKTNTLTGGTLRLVSVGTTTDDWFTGFTELWGIDANTTAGETALLVSVAGGAVQRVSVGANDSGGAGYRVLRVPN